MVGCTKKNQQNESQVGTASASYSDVITSSSGYIIEDAKIIINKNDPVVVDLNNALKLGSGKTSVMIIRGTNSDNSANSILALQFPSFAQGAVAEFDGSPQLAQFVLYGNQNGQPVVKESGLISGSVRCVKTQPSTIDLGLNRQIMDGVGTMEVIVSNIQSAGFNFDSKKKYVAQYSLPMIKLGEFARLRTPS